MHLQDFKTRLRSALHISAFKLFLRKGMSQLIIILNNISWWLNCLDFYNSLAFLAIHWFKFKTFAKIADVRWPRELNALQLQKTHANRKSISKSRKHFHHFDSRWCKCSQHKQIKKHTAIAHNTTKYILFAARFFFGCVVSTCSVCVVKLRKSFP